MNCYLYKYIWDNNCSPGYVVYRSQINGPEHDSPDYRRVHRVALFVQESDASNFCDYRNFMTARNGTDDPIAITDFIKE